MDRLHLRSQFFWSVPGAYLSCYETYITENMQWVKTCSISQSLCIGGLADGPYKIVHVLPEHQDVSIVVTLITS